VASELADSTNFRHQTIAKNGSFVFFGRVGVMVNAGVSLFTQLDEEVSSCVHIDRRYGSALFHPPADGAGSWELLVATTASAAAGAASSLP
jgi:hypothetical protein